MHSYLRYGLIATAVVSGILAVGFFRQMPWATSLWPWPDSRLSYIFLASIAAAIGAPVLWVGLSGEYGALRGGALNLLITNFGIALTAFQQYTMDSTVGALVFGSAALVLGAVSVAIFGLVRGYRLRDSRPLPRPVRASFALFAALLILLGGALLLGAPVFPWPLQPLSAAGFGWIFVGAACYFLYGCARPAWHNARGQLYGFLAYDLVLIGPFLAHFAHVTPDRLLNLIIYVAILVYSGALAVYYLFLNPATRSRPLPTPPSAAPSPPGA